MTALQKITAGARALRLSQRCAAGGRPFSSTVQHDAWAKERLGERRFYQQEEQRSGLLHRPDGVTRQKHTFGTEYFRSPACKDLLKVSWEGAVGVEIEDGRFTAVSTRAIKAGEIVERGILPAIAMDILDDEAPNPFVLKLGQDFLVSTFPCVKHSTAAPLPFLSSGVLMFYLKSASQYNIEVHVKESSVDGFEFDAVASTDIPAGSPMVRRVADDSRIPPVPQYAAKYHMSDEDVDSCIAFVRKMDEEKAALAGVKPDVLHEDLIREHLAQTRSGQAPIFKADRTVTIPHPVWGGHAVFACEDIKAGEIIEYGLHGKMEGLQGDKNHHVFTWNRSGKRYTDGRENVWATAGGNGMFYNSDYPANARMYRLFDQYRFIMIATADIKEGEEVMHLYASSSWRQCFVQDNDLPKLLPVEQAS